MGEKYRNAEITIGREKLKCLDNDSLCATLCTNTACGPSQWEADGRDGRYVNERRTSLMWRNSNSVSSTIWKRKESTAKGRWLCGT